MDEYFVKYYINNKMIIMTHDVKFEWRLSLNSFLLSRPLGTALDLIMAANFLCAPMGPFNKKGLIGGHGMHRLQTKIHFMLITSVNGARIMR